MSFNLGNALKYLQYVPVALSVIHSVQSIGSGKAATATAPLSLHGVRGVLKADFLPDATQAGGGTPHGVNAYVPLVIGLITTLAVEAAGYTKGDPLTASAPISVHGVRGTFELSWSVVDAQPAAISETGTNSFGIPDGRL